jgi:hypothetical protein
LAHGLVLFHLSSSITFIDVHSVFSSTFIHGQSIDPKCDLKAQGKNQTQPKLFGNELHKGLPFIATWKNSQGL